MSNKNLTQEFFGKPITFTRVDEMEVIIDQNELPGLFKHIQKLKEKPNNGIEALPIIDGKASFCYSDCNTIDDKVQTYIKANPTLKRLRYKHNGVLFTHENELIIRLNSKLDKSKLKAKIGEIGKITQELNYLPIYLVEIFSGDLCKTMKCIKNEVYVKKIEVNWHSLPRYERKMIPDSQDAQEDEDLSPNDVHENLGFAYFDEKLSQKNRISICLMDTGIYEKHKDIVDAFVDHESKSFLKNDKSQRPNIREHHGTWCAGILAANHDERYGLKGIGAGAYLISYRIAAGDSDRIQLSNFNLIDAFYSAKIAKCDVINCSWTLPYESELLSEAITHVAERGRNGKGIAVVVAAGNNGGESQFPATHKDVIAVSAVDLNNTPVKQPMWNWASSYGDNILLAAPAVNVLTIDIPGSEGFHNFEHNNHICKNYRLFGGTSAAATIVAGCIARLLQHDNSLQLSTIKKLLGHKDSLSAFNPKNDTDGLNFGCGVLNLTKLTNNLISNK